jgi:hypothetical protein
MLHSQPVVPFSVNGGNQADRGPYLDINVLIALLQEGKQGKFQRSSRKCICTYSAIIHPAAYLLTLMEMSSL